MGTFLKQQSFITVYRLPTKKNKLQFPFAAKKKKFALSIFLKQQTNTSCRFPLDYFPFAEFWKHEDMDMETWRNVDIETWRYGHGDIETWTWRH